MCVRVCVSGPGHNPPVSKIIVQDILRHCMSHVKKKTAHGGCTLLVANRLKL